MKSASPIGQFTRHLCLLETGRLAASPVKCSIQQCNMQTLQVNTRKSCFRGRPISSCNKHHKTKACLAGVIFEMLPRQNKFWNTAYCCEWVVRIQFVEFVFLMNLVNMFNCNGSLSGTHPLDPDVGRVVLSLRTGARQVVLPIWRIDGAVCSLHAHSTQLICPDSKTTHPIGGG